MRELQLKYRLRRRVLCLMRSILGAEETWQWAYRRGWITNADRRKWYLAP